MTIVGTGGEVRVGYQLAARLGPWTIEVPSPAAGRVTAELQTVDPWWITQPGTELRLVTRNAEWVWTTFDLIRPGVWRVRGAPAIARTEAGPDGEVSLR